MAGPPLAELASEPFAPAEIARLEEQRLAALELRVEADLAAGRHARAGRRAAAAHARAPVARAAARAADARAVPQRPPGRALEAYRARPRACSSRSSGSSREPSSHELQQAILAHDPGSTRRAPRPAPARVRCPAPPNRTIGREHELDAVAERLRASPAADADRPRRRRQDAAGARGGARASRPTSPTARASCRSPPLRRAEESPSAIVGALGDRAARRRVRRAAVERFLAAKQLLLVLDNFEHLLGGRAVRRASCSGVPARHGAGDQPRAARAAGRAALPVPPLRCRRSARTPRLPTPSRCSCERARAHDPEFDLSDGNAPRSPRSAAASTGCRWRSSWRPRAAALLSPGEIAERLDGRSARWARRARRARAPADAARDDRLEPRAARRRRAGRASRASRSSPAARRSRPRRR